MSGSHSHTQIVEAVRDVENAPHEVVCPQAPHVPRDAEALRPSDGVLHADADF